MTYDITYKDTTEYFTDLIVSDEDEFIQEAIKSPKSRLVTANTWLYEHQDEMDEAERLNVLLPLIRWSVEQDLMIPFLERELQRYYNMYINRELQPILAEYEADEVIDDLVWCYKTYFEKEDWPLPLRMPKENGANRWKGKKFSGNYNRFHIITYEKMTRFFNRRIRKNEKQVIAAAKSAPNARSVAADTWLYETEEDGIDDRARLDVLLPLIKWSIEHDLMIPLLEYELQNYYDAYASHELQPILYQKEADEVIDDLVWCYETYFGKKAPTNPSDFIK